MMAENSIGGRMKLLFFDDKKVAKAMDQATARALSRFGAEVRRTARSSIKESPGPSPAGSPPHSHVAAVRRARNKKRKAQGQEPVKSGFAGLKFILFAYDRLARSVIIGPASNRTRSLTIPEILEKGADPKHKVARRPFMVPALQSSEKQLPALWAKSIK